MSLDLKDAKIISDILKWDNTKSKPDEIDVIWFSMQIALLKRHWKLLDILTANIGSLKIQRQDY